LNVVKSFLSSVFAILYFFVTQTLPQSEQSVTVVT